MPVKGRSFGQERPPLTDLLKNILLRYPDGGQILKRLEKAKVTPIFKKGDRCESITTIGLAISVISAIARIFEKLMSEHAVLLCPGSSNYTSCMILQLLELIG
ncbi:Hypothetical predicted protein [Paramuricea clavata]|uniref:Uncharacterized protein n=1 Tax=Paramuricea clavata TaxID=317549 RepID=A0A6S7G7P3_PARCT|nr:Hypothetical predicted protein [Paramuricea clavata]